MPVSFSFVYVGDVDFDDGDVNGADAVSDGDGSVGVCAWIHDHTDTMAVSFLKFVDEAAFMVGLVILELHLGKRDP